MLSSNACVSALIEKYSSTFSSPSNSSERTREGTPAFSTRSRVKNRTRCAEKKKKEVDATTRKRATETTNLFLKAVFVRSTARARGVVSMEEESERYNKVFPKRFDAFLRHFCKKDTRKRSRFRGGKGGNGEIFIQFSDFSGTLFFSLLCVPIQRKKKFSSRERERGLECSNYAGKDLT